MRIEGNVVLEPKILEAGPKPTSPWPGPCVMIPCWAYCGASWSCTRGFSCLWTFNPCLPPDLYG